MASRVELRAVSAVGVVYITRMLGLFMILPVLALNADQYANSTTFSIGLALGVYGLMQAVLQVPFGKLSDRIGRKPVILIGLSLFAAGSLLAALSTTIEMLIFARAIQGAGAVSAALLALLSECSREQNRSKLMAILGISIGLSFGVAMVLGPLLAATWGVQSIFWLCVVLAAIGALAIVSLTPIQESASTSATDRPEEPIRPADLLELRRLNLGIFSLHAAQMSLWLVVPVVLQDLFGINQSDQWIWYLLAVGGGFVLMAPVMQALVKRNRYRATMLIGIVSLALAQLILSQAQFFWIFVVGLLVFFWGFNLLEATLPAVVSRRVNDQNRGRAMGWYATSQFLGTFVGGTLGGWLVSQYGFSAIFYLGLALFGIWFVVALPTTALPNIKSFVTSDLSAEEIEKLENTYGVISVVDFPEQKEIFVKANLDLIETETIESYGLK